MRKPFVAAILMYSPRTFGFSSCFRSLSFQYLRPPVKSSTVTMKVKAIHSSATPTTIPAADNSEDSQSRASNLQSDQDRFVKQMKDWRGTSRSTSEFVTHFIASESKERNITVQEAVLSVLPKEITMDSEMEMEGSEAIKRNLKVLERESDSVLGRIEMNFRNDPRQFPLHRQLNPLELIAMGSVWFLPAEAPRDPALGLKPMRLEAKNLTSVMKEGDYLRVHHMPRRFPEVHAFDWGKEVNEDEDENEGKNEDEALNLDSNALPGVIIHEDIEKGYIILNKPAGVPVHPTVDNVLENVAGAIGRSIIDKQRSRLEKVVEAMDSPKITSQSTSNSTNQNQTLTWQRNGVKRHRKAGRTRKKKESPILYVVAPQRLDQNTSGVFVVATKKIFAGYFAKLLRAKTGAHLKASNATSTSTSPQNHGSSSSSSSATEQVRKKYRCLVCIQPNKRISKEELLSPSLPPSMWDEVERLKALQESNELVRHYLEPTKRAPRIYSEDYHEDWLECLMKITDVGKAVPVAGSASSDELCNSLWGRKDNKPKDCIAVVQVEVEILTGRAHQIRGQLSNLGYSLCGDAMYGGTSTDDSRPNDEDETKERMEGSGGYFQDGYVDSDKLALQCCELHFPDPDYVKNKKGEEAAIRSDRVNEFRLQKAWWSVLLDKYDIQRDDTFQSATGTTTNDDDWKVAKAMKTSNANEDKNLDPLIETRIPRIQLSSGQHKYVVVKATHSTLEQPPSWFVKSASPEECGGPFHADVARGLVSDLNSFGYDTVVLGGGRIDYNPKTNHAHVYGFSYGFGKGEHDFVSILIEEAGISSSFDNSDNLY